MAGVMEADIAMDMLEEIRVIINANLESLIEEQKAIFGEVAEVSQLCVEVHRGLRDSAKERDVY